ncbi:MAG: HAMP domain-containing histidine kinase [Bacteroidales bacterium]|nr:HAMP domain-containing histidine kinase [Bacteroidales bacterium]
MEKEQPIQLKDSGITEFKELNQAICKLTEKIKTDYQTLKEFTENASHEMQSPLSVLHTKLEETIQHPELSEDQLKQINKALVAARQLSRLNHSLLLLAKIENRQFSQAAEIDMAEALTNTLKLFEDLTATKNITIEKSLENRVLVTTDPLLVNTLLSNLIGNAIKHNVSNGKIRIELNNNMLKIGNTGPTLNSPPDKMFERFVKGVPSSRSLGLGLAIAKKICEIKGWKISYNLYNEWHEIRILFGYFKE